MEPEQALAWERPRLGQSYDATGTSAGTIRLEDGREFSSPSRAAMEAAQIPAYDCWYAWRLNEGSESLHELRVRLVVQAADNGEAVAEEHDSGSSYRRQQEGSEYPGR